jgi:hypothetical protein
MNDREGVNDNKGVWKSMKDYEAWRRRLKIMKFCITKTYEGLWRSMKEYEGVLISMKAEVIYKGIKAVRSH